MWTRSSSARGWGVACGFCGEVEASHRKITLGLGRAWLCPKEGGGDLSTITHNTRTGGAEGGHRPVLGLCGGLFKTGNRTGEAACVGACAWPVHGPVHGLCMACAWACVGPVSGLCLACVLPVSGLCLACAWARVWPVHGPVSGLCLACEGQATGQVRSWVRSVMRSEDGP